MLWALLVDKRDLAQRLWSRTTQPLRAALAASQLCRSLSGEPDLFIEEERLIEHSLVLEGWACRLLDHIASSEQALPLLGLVPSIELAGADASAAPRHIMLWDESALDSALMDEGLSEPWKAFVQHKHVRHVLLCFFAGDFPGSHARIPRDAWLDEILLQVAFFFIPGTVCEIFPPRPAYITAGAATGAHRWSSDRSPSIAASSWVIEAGDDTWDAEYLRKTSDAPAVSNTARARDDADRALKEDAVTIEKALKEHSLRDVWNDLVSLRGFHFFLVPKVKFATYAVSVYAYSFLLMTIIVADPRPQQLGRMVLFQLCGPAASWSVAELVFWICLGSRSARS